MLKQRVITALVLAAVLLGALFGLNASWFSVFAGAVILVASREWAHLSGVGRLGANLYTVGMAALLAGLFVALGFDRQVVNLDWLLFLLLSGCSWWAVALLWVQGYPSSAILWGSRAIRLAMGIFVLVPAWLSLSWLAGLDAGHWLILVVLLTVACADIGAYFSGRAFGRRKLAPQVSPGKTLEGFAGGVLLVLIVIAGVIAVTPSQHSLALEWTIVVVATVLASVLGDLLESMVKRHRGVKDSGRLLPGHGGVLDRLDSLTAALPVFGLMYMLLIHPLP